MLGLVLTVMIGLAGCFTPYDKRDPRPPKLSLPEFENGGMLKKVALSLFDNRTQLRFEEVEQSFFLPFISQIKADGSDMLLSTPYDPDFPAALVDETLDAERGGTLDNLAIAQTSRELGLSAVITGRLENITSVEREKGFWLFKKNQHYERIMIQVDVYEAETGAKLLSNAYLKEIKISDDEFQLLANGAVENSPAVMEAYQDLAEEIGDDVCEILNNTKWIGFVTRVDSDRVTLSSGSDVGLQPGTRLELYNSDRIFKNAKGDRYFVPGIKTGSIEITAANPHSARAKLLPDSKAGPGYVVRFR